MYIGLIVGNLHNYEVQLSPLKYFGPAFSSMHILKVVFTASVQIIISIGLSINEELCLQDNLTNGPTDRPNRVITYIPQGCNKV